jgi:hypothetical protein
MELTPQDKSDIRIEMQFIKQTCDEILAIRVKKEDRDTVLQKMIQLLNAISTIAILSNATADLTDFRRNFWDIQIMYEQGGMDSIRRNQIERFCFYANSIAFTSTNRGLKLQIAEKIENASVFGSLINFDFLGWLRKK